MSFKFCSACGTSLPHAPPITCVACGTDHWLDPKPCAGAVIGFNNKLLLVRRAYEPWQDCWDLPSGFVGSNEHPLVTAEREVLEETGLLITVVGFLGMWLDLYTDDKVTLNIYYSAAPANPFNIRPDLIEVSEVKWFEPDSLPDKIAFPKHIPEVLRAWQEANRQKQYAAMERTLLCP